MNAQQRRKAYRALPKAGAIMTLRRPRGPVTVRVLGRTERVIELACIRDTYSYDGERPSIHRVRVETIGDLPTRSAPLLARLS
jgi:hypothetical protein